MVFQILSANRSSRMRRRAGSAWRYHAAGLLLVVASLALVAVLLR
jgi:hypothetical protein